MTVAAAPEVRLAALWRLLSLGFAPPTEQTVAEVEALAEALQEVRPSPQIDDLIAVVRESRTEELAAQFFGLFGGTVLVAPYEGSYELDPVRQGRQMADVAAFYRAFGAEPNGPAAERPDHAGCELEFLAFLELRRLAAMEQDEDVELLEEIETTFIREHAGRWLPTFFAQVREAGERAPFYRALAVLGLEAIADALERRALEPTPLPRRRTRSPVESDSFDCGTT